ncbi:MAG: PIN domain-containing protein [Flavobacteriaceae bacterium]|jgi:predicted nucleic acid-binding protein|nr:PIN domain-containing protein [Flavobacteriaceae bacterium]
MKIFLDANILVAVLNRQYPLFTYAAKILSLSERKNFELYTSPICLAIAFYFAEKKSGTQKAKEKIRILSEKLNISSTDSETVNLAVQNNKINDFEDGLEYYSAIKSKCQLIITEDVSDFYFAEIPVLNSIAFLESL